MSKTSPKKQSNTVQRSKRKSAVALLMIFALIITGIFAFLTAQDSKTNTFTVGKVDIELKENFDGAEYNKTSGDPAPIENIVPTQIIEKEPWIVNTGSNDAYTFMYVGIPVVSAVLHDSEGNELNDGAAVDTEAFKLLKEDGSEGTNEGWTLIKSFTDRVGEDGEPYNFYVYGYDNTLAVEGETAPLFNEVKVINFSNDIGETLKIPVNAYAIQTTLDGLDDEMSAPLSEDNLTAIWNICANEKKFQEPDWQEGKEPVVVNYYAPKSLVQDVSVDNSPLMTKNMGVKSAPVLTATSDESTDLSDYELVKTENYSGGDTLNPYVDNDLCEVGCQFDWKIAEVDENANTITKTTESAYTGMPLRGQVNLVADNIDLSNGQDEANYLTYSLGEKGANVNGSAMAPNGTTVVVPKFVNIHFDGTNYTILNGYYATTSKTYNSTLPTNIIENIKKFKISDTDYCIPVTAINVDSAHNMTPNETRLTETTQNIVLPQGIKTITYSGSPSVLESINIPYGTIGFVSFQEHNYSISSMYYSGGHTALSGQNNLKEIILPNSLISICGSAFKNTQISEINIPASVKFIGKDAFKDTNISEITLLSKTLIHESVINSGITINNIEKAIKCSDELIPGSNSAFIKIDCTSSEFFDIFKDLKADDKDIAVFNDSMWNFHSFYNSWSQVTTDEKAYYSHNNEVLIAHLSDDEEIIIPDSVKVIVDNIFNFEHNSISSVTYKGTTYINKTSLIAALTENGVEFSPLHFENLPD